MKFGAQCHLVSVLRTNCVRNIPVCRSYIPAPPETVLTLEMLYCALPLLVAVRVDKVCKVGHFERQRAAIAHSIDFVYCDGLPWQQTLPIVRSSVVIKFKFPAGHCTWMVVYDYLLPLMYTEFACC